MNRQEILNILADRRSEIEARFGVSSLMLFGSAARDELAHDSDIDILVTFSETPGILAFLEFKEYLQEILNRSVDLVTKNALKQQLRKKILQEALHMLLL